MAINLKETKYFGKLHSGIFPRAEEQLTQGCVFILFIYLYAKVVYEHNLNREEYKFASLSLINSIVHPQP